MPVLPITRASKDTVAKDTVKDTVMTVFLMITRASKDTVAILSALQAAYPKPRSPADVALHQLLGSTNDRITATAVRLLAEGNAQGLGQSHRFPECDLDCAVSLADIHQSALAVSVLMCLVLSARW
jgi:hypothetical protein